MWCWFSLNFGGGGGTWMMVVFPAASQDFYDWLWCWWLEPSSAGWDESSTHTFVTWWWWMLVGGPLHFCIKMLPFRYGSNVMLMEFGQDSFIRWNQHLLTNPVNVGTQQLAGYPQLKASSAHRFCPPVDSVMEGTLMDSIYQCCSVLML